MMPEKLIRTRIAARDTSELQKAVKRLLQRGICASLESQIAIPGRIPELDLPLNLDEPAHGGKVSEFTLVADPIAIPELLAIGVSAGPACSIGPLAKRTGKFRVGTVQDADLEGVLDQLRGFEGAEVDVLEVIEEGKEGRSNLRFTGTQREAIVEMNEGAVSCLLRVNNVLVEQCNVSPVN